VSNWKNRLAEVERLLKDINTEKARKNSNPSMDTATLANTTTILMLQNLMAKVDQIALQKNE